MYSEKSFEEIWNNLGVYSIHDVSGCEGTLSITREKGNEIKSTLESLSIFLAALFWKFIIFFHMDGAHWVMRFHFR